MGSILFSNVTKSKFFLIWQVLNYDHKFLGQQMEKLSRKVRFIFSVKPDGLISVAFEINVFNVNALWLGTSTITKADLTWLLSGKL